MRPAIRLALAVTLALVVLGPLGACAPPRVPESDMVDLSIDLTSSQQVFANGLRVVVHYQVEATSAHVHVQYHAGSKDDPVGMSGMAHLVEHLMFRGAKHTSGKDHNQWVDEVGGEANAFTTLDATDYFDEVPLAALTRALWLEADRMAHPLAGVDEPGFAAERDVVLNELRERYDNVPYGNLTTAARLAVFGEEHPYGAPVIGRTGELARISLAHARAFTSRYYGPSNATLVVCSSLPRAEVLTRIVKYFATIPPRPPVPTLHYPAPRVGKARPVIMDANVSYPALALAWAAPGVHAPGSEELAAGLVYLEGALTRRLVYRDKLANEVDVTYERSMLGGLAMIVVRLEPRRRPEDVIDAIDDEAERFGAMGEDWFPDRFADLRTGFMVRDVRALETSAGRALRILHDVEYHGSTNAAQQDLKRLQALKVRDVALTLRWITSRPRAALFVRMNPSAPAAGIAVQ